MINRQNWLDVKEFLSFHGDTLQNDSQTVGRMRSALRHLLEWADDKPFGNVARLSPAFPVYLANKTNESGKPFTVAGGEKTLIITRQFFNFARSEWQARYKGITAAWIKTLVLSKRNSSQSRLKEHKHYTLESVLKIAALWETAETLEARRDIAGVAFLFLSGMRVGAFTSIPLGCVNIADNEIYQLPEKGVKTKNRKAAVTHLLQIPELNEIVTAWDSLLRGRVSDSDLFYPVMERGRDEVLRGKKAHENRGKDFASRLKGLCILAGVPYLSPHKLRHGHVVYALKNAKDFQEFKAVSQNVMHSSTQITDSIYGNLSSGDVKRVISGIGAGGGEQAGAGGGDLSALLSLLSNPDVQKAIDKATNGAKPANQKTKGK